jgi:hypothetical protein
VQAATTPFGPTLQADLRWQRPLTPVISACLMCRPLAWRDLLEAQKDRREVSKYHIGPGAFLLWSRNEKGGGPVRNHRPT